MSKLADMAREAARFDFPSHETESTHGGTSATAPSSSAPSMGAPGTAASSSTPWQIRRGGITHRAEERILEQELGDLDDGDDGEDELDELIGGGMDRDWVADDLEDDPGWGRPRFSARERMEGGGPEQGGVNSSSSGAAKEWLEEGDDESALTRMEEEELEKALRRGPTMFQMWGELLEILDMGGPLSVFHLLWYLRYLVSLLLLSRQSPLSLAAAAVALAFANTTGFTPLLGLAAGLEPLSSQAFGAQDGALLGSLLRRGSGLLVATCPPIALLWACLGPILHAAGQDPSLSRQAAAFAFGLLPGLPAVALLAPLRVFLLAQGIARPAVGMAAAGLAAHVVLTIALVEVLPFGCAGAAVAASLSDWLLWLLLSVYVLRFSPLRRRCLLVRGQLQPPLPPEDASLTQQQQSTAVPSVAQQEGAVSRSSSSIRSTSSILGASSSIGFFSQLLLVLPVTSSAYRNWTPLLRCAIPAAAATCVEWWLYELCVLLAGALPDATAAAATLSIALNCDSILYCVTAGLAVAAGARVGNLLGAGAPSLARNTAAVAMACGLAVGAAALGLILWLRLALARAFTDDPAILSAADVGLPLVGVLELFGAVYVAMSAVLRGAGRVGAAALVSVSAFGLLGLPLCLCLCFALRLGLTGLLAGLLAATAAAALLSVVVAFSCDWRGEAARADARVRAWRLGAGSGVRSSGVRRTGSAGLRMRRLGGERDEGADGERESLTVRA